MSAVTAPPEGTSRIVYREIGDEHLSLWRARGRKVCDFFHHRTYTLSRRGPEAVKRHRCLVGSRGADSYWTLSLHAHGSIVEGLPESLLHDDEGVGGRQQFGMPHHIACASFSTEGRTINGLSYSSDLDRRHIRTGPYHARVQSSFQGWPYLLLNALLDFAVERGFKTIFSPMSELVRRSVDIESIGQPGLIELIYDVAVTESLAAKRQGDWWLIDVARNRDRVIPPDYKTEPAPRSKTICVTHDIERGLGHLDVDADFARKADELGDFHLDGMLAVERKVGVSATYNLVGRLYHDVRERIAADGHCIAFHSFDHDISKPASGSSSASADGQLARCRSVDHRIRGYRAPRSLLTPELSAEALTSWSFDWLASSVSSLRMEHPQMRDNLVYIPILFDDFPLYRHKQDYESWERQAIDRIGQGRFVAFGLHDCYGGFWLSHYPAFLEKLARLGTLRSCDQVADQVLLENCV